MEKGEKAADIKTKYETAKAELEKKIASSRLGKAFPHIHRRDKEGDTSDDKSENIEKTDNGDKGDNKK